MDTWAISTFFIMKNAAMDIYYMSPYGNIFTSLGYPSGVSQEELSCSLELRFNLLGSFPTLLQSGCTVLHSACRVGGFLCKLFLLNVYSNEKTVEILFVGHSTRQLARTLQKRQCH